ncbi:hypothetical protein D9M73_157200 [compost metagenome]
MPGDSARRRLSSIGSKANSTSSERPMRNTAVLVAGSNSAARLTAVEIESRAGESRAKISTALADGSMLRPVRTNKGSSNRPRRRESAALMAGWPRNSFSAARVTLRSCINVSKTINRFRSTRRRSLRFIWSPGRVSKLDVGGHMRTMASRNITGKGWYSAPGNSVFPT